MDEGGARAVLFDIDGTLISTGGASDRAWRRAFEELHGVDVDIGAHTGRGVPDPAVGRQAFAAVLGREPAPEEMDALMSRRLEHLREEVQRSPGYVVQDGARELLERLSLGGILLGLTTGNTEEAARIKLARAGLDRFFGFGGFGSDSEDRGELTRIALARAVTESDGALAPADTISVGDTPRDVEAGHGAGLRVVGVATGDYSVRELREAGADFALGSLRDFGEVSW